MMDDSLDEYERAKLVTWDYPLTDRYTKLWDRMLAANLPQTWEEGLLRVRHSPSMTVGFALIGELIIM